MLTYDKFFIGGEWVEPAGNETLKVLSPTTEEVIGSVPVATNADMDRCPARSRRSFIHAGVGADAFTFRITRPANRPQPSGAEIVIGNVTVCSAGTARTPGD